MKRKDFKKLKPGDKVRIVSEKTGRWWNPKMDKWLGKVMTVRENLGNAVLMKEDIKERGCGWFWYHYMIDCVVSEPVVTEHLVRGNKTIVKLSNGKVGIARCNPTDKFDMYMGVALALARAYGVFGFKPAEPKTPQSKVGDRVRIKPFDEAREHLGLDRDDWEKMSAYSGVIVATGSDCASVMTAYRGNWAFALSSLVPCEQPTFTVGDIVSVARIEPPEIKEIFPHGWLGYYNNAEKFSHACVCSPISVNGKTYVPLVNSDEEVYIFPIELVVKEYAP